MVPIAFLSVRSEIREARRARSPPTPGQRSAGSSHLSAALDAWYAQWSRFVTPVTFV
jgi:hypothetical protein